MDIEKAITELIDLGTMEPCDIRTYLSEKISNSDYLDDEYNVYAAVTGYMVARLLFIRNDLKIKRMQEEKYNDRSL